MFPSNGSLNQRPLPSAGSRSGRFPGFLGTMRRSDSLSPVPLHFVAFVPRYRLRGDGRASQVPGEPSCAHALLSDPGGAVRVRPLDPNDAAFRLSDGVGPLAFPFRGSITRPMHSLSTLRRAGLPAATQDSLPAAGQLCRAGLCTRWVPLRGFRRTSRHLLLLIQASPGATENGSPAKEGRIPTGVCERAHEPNKASNLSSSTSASLTSVGTQGDSTIPPTNNIGIIT